MEEEMKRVIFGFISCEMIDFATSVFGMKKRNRGKNLN